LRTGIRDNLTIFDDFVFSFLKQYDAVFGVFVSTYCLDISVICCLVIDALLFDGFEKQ